MGVARTFQRNNVFQNLSVIENLRLALEVRLGNPLDFLTPTGRNQKLLRRAAELMAQVHLAGDGARIARSLSYGEQRQLEIGIALAGAPELLLLDEPTSGMSPAETAQMIELIGSLPRTLSMLMIEHDMSVVFSVADRITVLYYGGRSRAALPRDPGAGGPRSLPRDAPLMLGWRTSTPITRWPHPGMEYRRGPAGRAFWAKRRRQNHDHPHRATVPAARTHRWKPRYAALPPYLVARPASDHAAGRGIFPSLTVGREPDDFCPQRRAATGSARIFELFPQLRPASAISTLSGGEQQMRQRSRADAQPGTSSRRAIRGTCAHDRAGVVKVLARLKQEGLHSGRAEPADCVHGRRPPHVMNKGEICFHQRPRSSSAM
jgi:ABC-type branched-subunit amino acid transport system ATPase component